MPRLPLWTLEYINLFELVFSFFLDIYIQKWNFSLDGITDSMDMNLGELREMMRDRETWHAEVHRVAKSQIQLSN